jgi:phosphopantothenoylcysteine decarboxylase/phosphopantothenate--cysteine ligase
MKKNILLGVTSSIAIYKSCSLIRALRREGANVRVIMTPSVAHLIRPLLFQSLTENLAYIDMFNDSKDYSLEHISLAKWGDLAVIAPCSANTLAKICWGICDNLLTTLILALPKTTPVIIAPAMNNNMWKNEITQRNVQILKKFKKYIFVDPKKGKLACGTEDMGAMAEVETIVKIAKKCAKT